MCGIFVSIVLPTYNRADRLLAAIESCLTQTYPHLELIVVNDGSTDNTAELLNSLTDERVRVIHQPNAGLPAALNAGFAIAKGEFLSWTSDDNHYHATALERLLARAQAQDKPCLVYADYWAVYPERNEERRRIDLSKQLAETGDPLSPKNQVGACFLYHRLVREAIGDYDPNLFLIEDYEYWLRVAKKFPLIHLPEALYDFTLHSQSLTSTRRYEVQWLLSTVQRRYGKIGWLSLLKQRRKLLSRLCRDKNLNGRQRWALLLKLSQR